METHLMMGKKQVNITAEPVPLTSVTEWKEPISMIGALLKLYGAKFIDLLACEV